MILTAHFKLAEFEKSPTASAHHIDNHVPLDSTGSPTGHDIYKNLKNLCEQVLEPLRQHFDVPIIIGSGYRCPKLNTLVGGVANSQHKTGEAADIGSASSPTAMAKLKEWFVWIMDNCDFDQLILEHTKNGTYWIHVSCKRDKSKNRHHVIQNLLKVR